MTDERQTGRLWGPEAQPPWTIATAVGLIVGYVAIMYVTGFIIMLIVGFSIPIADTDSNLVDIVSSGQFVGLTNSMGNLIALGLIYWVVKHSAHWKGSFLSLVKLEAVSDYWLGAAVGGALLLMLSFELSARLWDVSPIPELYPSLFDSPLDCVMMIVLLAISPFVEEILHRGVFYPAVAGRHGLWVGVVASIMAYGAPYVITYASDSAALLRTFVMGTLCTLLRAGSKSVGPGIVAFAMMDVYLIARTLYLVL